VPLFDQKKRDNNVILTIILSAEYAYLIIIINKKNLIEMCGENKWISYN